MSQNNRKRTRNSRRSGNSNSQNNNSPSNNTSPATSQINTPEYAFTPGNPSLLNDPNTQESYIEDQVDESEFVQDLPNEEEEDGEDLFGPGAENDYIENPALDHYDVEGLDDQEYDALDIGQRREVDQLLAERDRQINRNPGDLIFNEDDETNAIDRRRRRKHLLGLDEVTIEDDDQIDLEIQIEDLNDIKASSIAEWVTMEGPRRAIQKEFKKFVAHVGETGRTFYTEKLRELGEGNKETLEINYNDLVSNNPVLAYLLTNAPRLLIQIFDDVAFDIILKMFSNYDKIHSEIHCRITDVPTLSSLRDLRQAHLNCLIKVTGVVSRRSSVFPQLKYVKYKCGKCSIILGPFYQDPSAPGEIKVGNCHNCDSKGPFIFCSEQTVYRNYQKITLQETPGTVPPGRLPRQREVILLWDLVDSIKPGEEIEVTGIYMNNLDASLNNKYGFPVFSTIIEANYIRKINQNTMALVTEDDEREIKKLANDPNILKRVINSIAPSIFGHTDIKTSIAMSLFGGVPKGDYGNRKRGDINVLLLGDPGTAKSQFLKYAEKTAHRCVYATGQGASAVGLTASVRKDHVTREWTLEGGALVLADQGVCLIDEFDKMNDKDRTSIHEAMEQQTISISKAGIVASLQARCSIIAAANPIRGRYNPTLPLTQNVNLTEPILSRFDLICVVRDTVDASLDYMLAQFVIDSHDNSHPDRPIKPNTESDKPKFPNIDYDVEPIDQDLLKKYITYAREKKPELGQIDKNMTSNFYSTLREASNESGGLSIGVRHLESIIRMSEAVARIHLRDHVRRDDLDFAIKTFLDSFISTQKASIQKELKNRFYRYMQNDDTYSALSSLLRRMELESIQMYQSRTKASHILRDGNNGTTVQDDDNVPEYICIQVDEFSARAGETLGDSIRPFIESNHLRRLGYTVQLEDVEDLNGQLVQKEAFVKNLGASGNA